MCKKALVVFIVISANSVISYLKSLLSPIFSYYKSSFSYDNYIKIFCGGSGVMAAWKPVELLAGVQFPSAALYLFACAKRQAQKDTVARPRFARSATQIINLLIKENMEVAE